LPFVYVTATSPFLVAVVTWVYPMGVSDHRSRTCPSPAHTSGSATRRQLMRPAAGWSPLPAHEST